MLAVAALVIGYLYLHLKNLQAVRPRGIDRRSEKDERTRVRIHITSVWANVLALLLISVVGFALLGLEIWRLNSAEKSFLSAPALEELLRTKLIDPKVQQQQHKEVVDAIREARPPGPTGTPDDGMIREKLSDLQAQVNRHEQILREKPLTEKTAIETAPAVSSFFFLIGAFILLGILFVAAAIWLGFYFLYNKNVISKKAYDVAKVGVTLGSLASGVTLLKDFHLVKNADSLIKFNIQTERPQGPVPPAAQPTQLQLHVYNRPLRHSVRPSGSVESDCGTGDAQRIGPFRDGRHLLEVAGQEKLRQVLASLVERSQSERLISVTLVGSVDRRELSPETTAIYGSNAGLARARSQTVSDQLTRAFAPDTVQIIHNFSGPVNFGPKVSADALAYDRAVLVCIYWRPKT